MDDIQFYDVKAREKVSVPVSEVMKKIYERPTKDGGKQVRYALRVPARKLTKFVSKEVFDSIDRPIEE